MIVGIGELLWDLFPDGRKVAGGAPFNFAFHCQQLGHPAAIVSRVGDDELGRELRAEVKRLGLTDEWIQTDSEHPTGTVMVTVDAAGQPGYEIVEGVAWDFIGWDESVEALGRSGRYAKAVCFGTLGQRGATSRQTIRTLVSGDMRVTPMQPLRVCDINLRPPFYSPAVVSESIATCDRVKVNDSELRWLAGAIELDCRDDEAMAIDLASREPGPTVWVTKGPDGAFVVWSGGDIDEPGVPARVVDTVGAGDSFTAAMVCLHLEGRPLRECARFATRYAARVCEFQGGTPRIDRREIEAPVK